MSGSTLGKPSGASFGVALSEARRREQRASERGARYAVSPEVREVRAAFIAEREAKAEEQRAADKASKEIKDAALRSILARGTIDELAEVARSIGMMDPRLIQSVVGEVFRQKSRSQAYQPDDGVALGAGASVRATSGRRRS